MSLQYIIDGYNVIHHPLFKYADKKIASPRLALVAFIRTKRLTGSPRNKVSVVFDGYPYLDEATGIAVDIRVIFAKEETADKKINRMVENSAQPKNVCVVSDDKEIRFFARQSGARPVTVEEFVKPAITADPGSVRGKRDEGKDPAKQELSYGEIARINQELKKLWLE